MSISGDIEIKEFKDHARERPMWLGSSEQTILTSYAISKDDKGRLTAEQFKFEGSDALMKCIDEILVNAADHYIRTNKVTEIKVSYKDGIVTVENNGPGINIHKIDKFDIYSVEAVISREFSGSNFNDDDEWRVTGGVNGLGMKLVNANSTEFHIETVDTTRKKLYKQSCYGLKNVRPPTITDHYGHGYTKISFKPDYAHLCRVGAKGDDHSWFTPGREENLRRAIEFRVYQITAFIKSTKFGTNKAGRIDYVDCGVYFNGEKVRIIDMVSFAKLFNDSAIMLTLGTNADFPWTIALCINTKYKKLQMSFLNAVYLSDCSHVSYLYKCIIEYAKKQIKGGTDANTVKLIKSTIESCVAVFNSIQMPLPQFSSQTKEKMTMATAALNKFKKIYVLSDEDLSKIWKFVSDHILSIMDIKTIDSEKKSQKKKVRPRKYEKAEKYGKASYLFIPEGDSACGMLKDILVSSTSPISTDHYGTYNIQGVPPNPLKNISYIEHAGRKYIKKTKKLRENIALQGLVTVLGLDYDKKYESDKEFAELSYGGVIIAVDQDVDGVGQICSLILVFFIVFWPALIKRGFVKRLVTPLVRVYHGKEVFRFYSEKEYDEWVTNKFGSLEDMPQSYKPHYYKGLSTHTKNEVHNDIGRNILKNIYTFTWDDATAQVAEISYGKETFGRKQLLKTKVTDEYDPDKYRAKEIDCSAHFKIESKAFQLEFMERKLKSCIDGFVPSQRKVLAAARIKFKQSNTPIKIFQLGGYCAENMGYHHGDASMNATISMMAQTFTGSNIIPPLMAISNGFGTRYTGRDVTAQPRYLNLNYNKTMDLMFPREDDWLLDYTIIDGNQCEPRYYVPVLPYSIMETTTTTGTGWKIDVWARDWREVIKAVNYTISQDTNGRLAEASPYILDPFMYPGMRYARGKSEVCYGRYTLDRAANIVRITELPLKVWSHSWKCELLGLNEKEDPLMREVITNGIKTGVMVPVPPRFGIREIDTSRCGNDRIDIKVYLEPGALAEIEAKRGDAMRDSIEHHLNLAQNMTPHLNMIGEDGAIREFGTYEDVFSYWYKIRKDLYITRIRRRNMLLDIKINYWSNILRFILEAAVNTITIDKLPEAECDVILEKANYVKFYKTLVFNPQYTKVDKLEDLVYNSKQSSYKYIYDITVGMTSAESIAKIEKDIEELKATRNDNLTWDKLWKSEIAALEESIKKGIEKSWNFEIEVNFKDV